MVHSPTKVVQAADGSGYSGTLLQIFGLGPRWTIRCGECGVDFTARLPMVECPRVPCTHCGTVNELPLTTEG